MTYIQKPGVEPRPFVRIRRAVGVMAVAVVIGVSALIPALADPPKPKLSFAHKYTPVYFDSMAKTNLALVIHAPSFQSLAETKNNGLPGNTRQGLPGGIHQGRKAVTVGAGARQPVRFEFRPEGRIFLSVGDQSIVTGLLAAQARPMASLVEEGNNGLVAISDRATHNGKGGYKPKVAGSYIDTEDGYWLLWADAIAEDLFYGGDFRTRDFPDGLTIVDSDRPVTISTDGGLEIRGGTPWVAFWKSVGGKPGRILRYDDLGLVMKPRDQDDVHAIETVRRVFKWAPVMRLAAESDPVAFRTFIRKLEQVRIAPVTTPHLLIEE